MCMKDNTRLLAGIALVVASGLGAGTGNSAAAQQQAREPAQTMSYRGAPWLERAERAAQERPEEVLDAMDLRPGDVVADIGVGSGYFARRIARRVDPGGTVYGVDIQPEMLRILMENARAEGIENIEAVLGDAEDPKLPAVSVDWMLLVDVYHEIAEPAAMLSRMHQALKPDGRVALLEYRLEDASGDHIYADHRMSVRQVLEEWAPAGFELTELLEFLPSQHMFIFRKTTAGEGNLQLPPALPAMDLLEAVAAGEVEVEVRGQARDAVSLRARRTGEEALLLTLPAGTLFAARGGFRDMVAVRDAYVLLNRDREEVVVRAAGTRWDRPVANGRDRFDLVAAEDGQVLAAVARAVQAGTYRVDAGAAVSYAPQSVGTAEAAIWIALHDPEFAAIEAHLGDADVPALYAGAFGLVFVDRARLDATATRAWSARQEIFPPLQVPDLDRWYRARNR